MTGIKNFILGFTLSFCGVVLGGQLYSSAPVKSKKANARPVTISLFKNHQPVSQSFSNSNIFANIQKETLSVSSSTFAESNIPNNVDGIEDDEILSISNDDIIPIEFGGPVADEKQAEVVLEDNEENTAMLPTDLRDDETFDSESPWAVAKGSPNIKNKKLLENISKQTEKGIFSDNFTEMAEEDKNLSYKVAERIKQSIIFPIPDEILNDENLTPTFIHDVPKKDKKAISRPVVSTPKRTPSPAPVIEVEEIEEEEKVVENTDDKNILDNISSWFSDDVIEKKEIIHTPAKKAPPAYSSQGDKKVSAPKSSNEDLASFYASLQETKKEHSQRKIIPSELKLSFQPERAEISGTTLNWLKQFSEATMDGQTYLQVRLNASTSTELQKKRLNLLYTIFMNNGVDLNKVDTVFLPTEPNTFIIRTLKFNQF